MAEFFHTVMPTRRLFFIQATLIAIVGFVHIVALQLYLYWQFPWLDVFVHFFGAMWVALFAVWLLVISKAHISFIRVFGLLVFVSIGWELFELWGGVPREANFAFDTTIDLIMDALGGVFGYFLARHLTDNDIMPPHEASQSDSS